VKENMAGELILFVEDEVEQLKYMTRFLEEDGYRVLGARNGIEAVALHHQYRNEIALVVMDIRLPKLNGWDAFQAMKKENPEVKTVFATAYLTPEVRSAIEKGELHGLFLKPYDLEALIAKISEVLRPPRLTGDL
jgi:CheY-like chemotaxis protein